MQTNERPSTPVSDDPQDWLCATPLLDLEDPKLRIRVLRITQLATSASEKAVRVHDYIKSMPFGCVPTSANLQSGVILRAGFGDCHTKGTLFVSMLRLVGIPARLRFVKLDSTFLEGIISLPDIQITHAIAEAYLSGRWIQVDTYVTDEIFEGQALVRLRAKNATLGFGIHTKGHRYWSGDNSAHAQYTQLDSSSLPTQDLGVAHDPEQFYKRKSIASVGRGWISRLKWTIAARLINHRVKLIRTQ